MKVTVHADVGPAVRRLHGAAARMVDARPAFQAIVPDLLAGEQARFATRGHGRWPALDPDTIRKKSRRGHDPRILQATGTLRRALTQRAAPGQRLEIGRDELTFGIEHAGAAYYGRFHQQGKGVPKRLVIAATPRLRKTISDRVRSFIVHAR